MHQIVTSFSLKRETLISIFIYMPGKKLISAVVEASLSHKREILINILRYTLLRSLISADIVTRHFLQKGDLNKHLRIHNGAKPYQCILCDKKKTRKEQFVLVILEYILEKIFSCFLSFG